MGREVKKGRGITIGRKRSGIGVILIIIFWL